MFGKLSQPTLKLCSIGTFYLIIAFIWPRISLQINSFEGLRGYFDTKALLKFKILFPAVAFMGHLLFAQYRTRPTISWLFPLSLFIVGWSVFDKLDKAINLHYSLLIGADIIIWSLVISDLIQTLTAIFRYWEGFVKVNYAVISEIWSKLSDDLFKLGIWLTVLLGLIFYYLVSFFLVDAILYSYLLLMPLLIIGAALYLLIFKKINTWIRDDLILIDGELSHQLDWEQVKNDPALPQKTVWFQYLSLIRNYLKELQKPVILLKSFLLYIFSAIFILSLPYFFGRVIEL